MIPTSEQMERLRRTRHNVKVESCLCPTLSTLKSDRERTLNINQTDSHPRPLSHNVQSHSITFMQILWYVKNVHLKIRKRMRKTFHVRLGVKLIEIHSFLFSSLYRIISQASHGDRSNASVRRWAQHDDTWRHQLANHLWHWREHENWWNISSDISRQRSRHPSQVRMRWLHSMLFS